MESSYLSDVRPFRIFSITIALMLLVLDFLAMPSSSLRAAR